MLGYKPQQCLLPRDSKTTLETKTKQWISLSHRRLLRKFRRQRRGLRDTLIIIYPVHISEQFINDRILFRLGIMAAINFMKTIATHWTFIWRTARGKTRSRRLRHACAEVSWDKRRENRGQGVKSVKVPLESTVSSLEEKKSIKGIYDLFMERREMYFSLK